MILVTGGGGYIGSHLVKKLKEDGEKVIVFDNFERGHKWAVKGVEVVEGDLRNKEDIKKVFNNFDIEEVYHFAAYSLVGESMQDPMKYFKGNVCVETSKGIVIITGCSHPKMEDILKAASQFGEVYGIIGGLHGTPAESLEGLKLICATHCTEQKDKIKQIYPNSYLEGGAGRTIEI
jgi:UDP-glucose 4-epimerase